MSVSTVSLVYGLLAIVGVLLLIWLGVMAVGSRVSESAAEGFLQTRERLARLALPGALVVAALAMAGSLYFSEVAGFQPCLMCWYQRIPMYPLVLILAIAAWRRESSVRVYVIPLAAIGAAISTYHYLVQWFPTLDAVPCTIGVPCTQYWFREFGFISIPFLALVAFLLIIALLSIPPRDSDPEEA